MGFGLFGKLPQKRDFLSINLPHAVLNPFETWLQSAVAASRNEIGRNWENYYLVAPIWRFWLGKDVLGTACTGSLMPSVDQVGRYFPLAIMYWAEPGESLTPPLINPVDGWYSQIEARMLAMLSDQPFEVGQILQGLVPPDYSTPRPPMPVYTPPPEIVAPAATPPRLIEADPPVEAEPEPVSATPEEVAPTAAVLDQPVPSVAEVAEAEADAAPTSGPDEWDVAADRALEAAAESLAAEPAAKSAPDTWTPEPMAADTLKELQGISAASFAPPAAKGGSPWDAPEQKAPKAHGGAAAMSLWDMPEAAPAEPTADEGTPASSEPIATVGTRYVQTPPGVPMAVLSDVPAVKAAVPTTVAAAPTREVVAAPVAEPWDAPPATAEPSVTQAPAAPAPLHDPQITTGEFKGGMVAVMDGVNSLSEALPQLMALDFAHFAQSRGYWWCGPSSSGGPRLFSRAGLPDPYFYTRMLMWPGN